MKAGNLSYLVVIACTLLIFSCADKGDQQQEETPPEQLQSDSLIRVDNEKSDDVHIPVYEAFSEYEKDWLQHSNDTLYVVNFWATWCKPCIKELPYFDEIHRKYKDQKVKVVLTSIDMSSLYEKKLIPFVKKRNIQSQVVLLDDPDQNTWINKVNKDWDGAIPASIFYKNDEKLFFSKSFEQEELDSLVNSLI